MKSPLFRLFFLMFTAVAIPNADAAAKSDSLLRVLDKSVAERALYSGRKESMIGRWF